MNGRKEREMEKGRECVCVCVCVCMEHRLAAVIRTCYTARHSVHQRDVIP